MSDDRTVPRFEDDFPMHPDSTLAQRFKDGLSKLNKDHLLPQDAINPSHYQGFSNGAEVIDITENLNFNRGNAVKYIARAGRKGDATEDLKKALWYIERELERMECK